MTPRDIENLRASRQEVEEIRNAHISITKKHVLIAGAIIGVILGILVAAVIIIAGLMNSYQSDQIKKNMEAIERINNLERPLSDAEVERRSQKAIRVCAAKPKCRDLFLSLGAQGPVGPVGPSGRQGKQGTPGKHGQRGDRGPRGYRGTTGLRGQRGPRGLSGRPGRDSVTVPAPNVEELQNRIDVLEQKLAELNCTLRALLKLPC